MLHLRSSYRHARRVFIIFVYTCLYLHQNKYETLHKFYRLFGKILTMVYLDECNVM